MDSDRRPLRVDRCYERADRRPFATLELQELPKAALGAQFELFYTESSGFTVEFCRNSRAGTDETGAL